MEYSTISTVPPLVEYGSGRVRDQWSSSGPPVLHRCEYGLSVVSTGLVDMGAGVGVVVVVKSTSSVNKRLLTPNRYNNNNLIVQNPF